MKLRFRGDDGARDVRGDMIRIAGGAPRRGSVSPWRKPVWMERGGEGEVPDSLKFKGQKDELELVRRSNGSDQ